ncbi:MAG: hypothetical protein K6D96_09900 [Acetatifactor sp.]|nr:hypothetical protein [Acetatifactor sp.]
MKKKLIGLVCAMTMVIGMSTTALAATSSTSSAAASSAAASKTTAATAEVLVTADKNTTGQVLTENTLGFFVEDTKVTGVAGATVSEVTTSEAKALIEKAQAIAGSNSFIATMVDLEVPAGTGKATFTLTCSNVWKGQNVTVLHKLANGTIETVKPDSVEDNKVTFTLNSCSPIAIMVNTGATSPKTGEIIAMFAAAAALCGAGAVAFGKKARK